MDSIIAAAQQGALKQCGPALEKLCSSSSSTAAESIRQKLITNKSIFKLYGQQQTQLLPQQQMQQCHAAALERQQQHLSHAAAAAAGSSAAMAAAHPAVAAHMQQITPYLNQLSRCLQQLGMVHKVSPNNHKSKAVGVMVLRIQDFNTYILFKCSNRTHTWNVCGLFSVYMQCSVILNV